MRLEFFNVDVVHDPAVVTNEPVSLHASRGRPVMNHNLVHLEHPHTEHRRTSCVKREHITLMLVSVGPLQLLYSVQQYEGMHTRSSYDVRQRDAVLLHDFLAVDQQVFQGV